MVTIAYLQMQHFNLEKDNTSVLSQNDNIHSWPYSVLVVSWILKMY